MKSLVKSKSSLTTTAYASKSSKEAAPTKAQKAGLNQTHVSKNNVMNLVHNVTVASPPSSAKERASRSEVPTANQEEFVKPRDRTRTRTLQPEEIVVLKPKLEIEVPSVVKKQPVAFEINFEEAKKAKTEKDESPQEDYNYESDFESYESDFESEVSSSDKSKSRSSEEPNNENMDNVESEETTEEEESEDGDDENYASILEVKSARERQLDSGNFDLLTKKTHHPTSQLNSIEESTVNSSDSGISYDDGRSGSSNKRLMSPRLLAFYSRGEELMKKITLDDMKFNLYETKPIPYDIYMQMYGQKNTQQTFCQTDSFTTNESVQTESIGKFTMWTQVPATFSKEGLGVIGSKLYNEEKIGVGEGCEELNEKVDQDDDLKSLEDSLSQINKFSQKEDRSLAPSSRATFDSQRLNLFLQNASITVANIIEKNSRSQEFRPSKISISKGYFVLPFTNQKILKNTKIVKLYTNVMLNNLFVTVHKLDNSMQNLICLWNILYTKNPLKIFTSWSELSCLEIHHELPEVLIAGCKDGTISMWDSKERIDWRQKIDNNFEIFAVTPCEVISLNDSSDPFTLINTVAIKSLPQRQMKSQNGILKHATSYQICSLHENGYLAIWTVYKMNQDAIGNDGKSDDKSFTFLAPSSKLKLIKNLVIDLNAKLERNLINPNAKKTNFEKKKYYFENDIFSDSVLKELQKMDDNKFSKSVREENFIFPALDVDLNEFFVATDSNLVLAYSRVNYESKSRKINVDGSNLLSPTALKVHPVNKNILAIGLSNGNLIFINNKIEEEPIAGFSRGPQPSTSKKSQDDAGAQSILSKSCTIQNIIENERKLYEESQALNNLEMEELKTFLINEALAEDFREPENLKLNLTFDKNIFNNFIVNLNGVRDIEFTKDGELMFVLIGNQIKIFNCLLGQEIENDSENQKFKDVKCVRGGDNTNYLVSLLDRFIFPAENLILSFFPDSIDHHKRDIHQ